MKNDGSSSQPYDVTYATQRKDDASSDDGISKAASSDKEDLPNIDEPLSTRRKHSTSSAFFTDIIPDLVVFLELLSIGVAGIIAWLLTNDSVVTYELQKFVFTAYIGILYYLIMSSNEPKKAVFNLKFTRYIENAIIGFLTSFLCFFSVVYGLEVSEKFINAWTRDFILISLGSIFSVRLFAKLAIEYTARRGVLSRRLVVLGTTAQAARFIDTFSESSAPFTRIVGIFAFDQVGEPKTTWNGQAMLGDTDDLFRYCREGWFDDIVVALPWSADREVTAVIERLKELPVNVMLTSDLIGFDLSLRSVSSGFAALPLFEVIQRPISGWNYLLKVIFDYTCTVTIIIFLSPVLLFIAVAIKFDSPGPILYRQQRMGFNNQPFSIYKFRSMIHNWRGQDEEFRQATRDDPRITRVGKFIRSTSLDELPQLFNVLDGSMSLVGPRPHAVSQNLEYGQVIRGYFARHKVKPGITGWAQVKGLRGETEKIEKMRSRIEHDIYYIENWSIILDIKILFATAFVVFFQKNAY